MYISINQKWDTRLKSSIRITGKSLKHQGWNDSQQTKIVLVSSTASKYSSPHASDSIKHSWSFVLTSKDRTQCSAAWSMRERAGETWSGWKDWLCHVELAGTERRGEKLHASSVRVGDGELFKTKCLAGVGVPSESQLVLQSQSQRCMKTNRRGNRLNNHQFPPFQ